MLQEVSRQNVECVGSAVRTVLDVEGDYSAYNQRDDLGYVTDAFENGGGRGWMGSR